MDKEEETKLIGFLVEKVTKGVRKQIKGYEKEINEHIDRQVLGIKYEKEEFEALYEQSKNIRCDFHALEDMIEEGKNQRKNVILIKDCINQANNRLLDMNMLHDEMQNLYNFLKMEVESARKIINKQLKNNLDK